MERNDTMPNLKTETDETREEARARYQAALAEEIKRFHTRWERTNLREEVIEALKELYSLYSDQAMIWLAELWDPETGGFYYSNSARDYEGFLPDLEDTRFALANLIGNYRLFKNKDDFLTRLSYWGIDDFAERLTSWVASLRAPDGYYYHPQWGKRVDDVGLFRHLNNANALFDLFGKKSSAPTAEEKKPQEDPSVLPWYMQSKEAIVEWLESFQWTRNQTYHSASVIGVMGPTLSRIGLIDTVIDYFDKKFEIYGNGTFEDAVDRMSLNGTMKVTDLYIEAGRTFPLFEKVLEATVRVLISAEPTSGICSVANPYRNLAALRKMANRDIDAAQRAYDGAPEQESALLADRLSAARERLRRFEEVLQENAVLIIRKTAECLKIFLKDDGAFSMRPDRCGAETCGVQWALRLPESDINGTNQGIQVIVGGVFGALLNEPPVDVWSPEVRERVLQILANKNPVKKRPIPSDA